MLRHTSIFKYLKLPDSQRNHCFPVAGQLCFSPCKHHCQGSAGRARLVALQCCKRYPSIYASRGEWQLKFKATYLNDSCSRMRWKTMGGNSTTSGSTVFTPSSYVVQTRRDNVYKHILSTCALQLQIQRGWRRVSLWLSHLDNSFCTRRSYTEFCKNKEKCYDFSPFLQEFHLNLVHCLQTRHPCSCG